MTRSRHLCLALLSALAFAVGCNQPPAPAPAKGPSTTTNTATTNNPGTTTPPATTVAVEDKKPARPTAFPPPTDEQKSLVQAAKDAFAAGNDDAAVLAFERLKETQPMSGLKATAILSLADGSIAAGEPQEAVNMLLEVQAQTPPFQEVEFMLGRAYKATGDKDKAILAFRESLKIQPMMLQAHVEIGGLLAEQGKGEESAQEFLKYETQIYKFAKVLEDPRANPQDKIAVAEALSFLPDDRAAEGLVSGLDDANRHVRLAVVRALVEVGTKSIVPALQRAEGKALEAGDPEMQQLIRKALTRIGVAEEHPDNSAGDAGVGPTFVKTDAGPAAETQVPESPPDKADAGATK